MLGYFADILPSTPNIGGIVYSGSIDYCSGILPSELRIFRDLEYYADILPLAPKYSPLGPGVCIPDLG